MTAALYVAIGAAIATALHRRPSDRDLLVGIRSALWIAWAHIVCSGLPPPRSAFFDAAWFAAFFFMARPMKPSALHARAVAWAGAGLAVEATLVATPSLPRMLLALVTTSIAIELALAMRDRRRLAARHGLHWASFGGTFAYLIPRILAERVGANASPPSTRAAAAALGLTSIILAAWGSFAFARAGGTPEPLDPPTSLATTGPFAYVRHPIALAEIGLVSSGALWWLHPTTLAYAALFSLALLGPVRWYEERKLRERYGAAYLAWAAHTPAYVPRSSPASPQRRGRNQRPSASGSSINPRRASNPAAPS